MKQHLRTALIATLRPPAPMRAHKPVLAFPQCAPLRGAADLAGRLERHWISANDLRNIKAGWSVLQSIASLLRGSVDSLEDAPYHPDDAPEPRLTSLLLPDLSRLLHPDGMPILDAGTQAWAEAARDCWAQTEEAAMELLSGAALPPLPSSAALAADQDARSRFSRAQAWLEVWSAWENAQQAELQETGEWEDWSSC